jgi:ATP-dependent exoDNAse (exonuclease V) alpha subunit
MDETTWFKRLGNGETMYTVVARHVPQRGSAAPLTAEIRRKLYAERGDATGDRKELMLSYINLFIGSRVRLTRNLFVEGGLYNGAMGTVWGFVFRGDGTIPTNVAEGRRLYGDMEDREREIPVVLVQMDGDDRTFTYSCSTSVPRLVPIVEVQSDGLVSGEYARLQIPLLPAEARTAHSVQGLTAHHGVVIDPGSTFFAGDYTALSRATSKEKVLLLTPFQEKHFTGHGAYRAKVQQEYSRLEQAFPQL